MAVCRCVHTPVLWTACTWVALVPAGCGVCPADVDDCAASPCCQQVCTNSPGGYECSCYAGYRLSADGCGCEGECWAAGAAGERAILRVTWGGLWPPPSTLSLGIGLAPASAGLWRPACSLPRVVTVFFSGLGLHP